MGEAVERARVTAAHEARVAVFTTLAAEHLTIRDGQTAASRLAFDRLS